MKLTDVERHADDGLAGGLQAVRSDLHALRHDVAGLVNTGAHRAGGYARGLMHAADAGARVFSAVGRRKAGHALSSARAAATRRPITTLAVLLGVGAVVLGLACSMHSRRAD
jgi:hypothetical protein